MARKINVLYITSGELISGYGLFETQVKSLLSTISNKSKDEIDIHLLSFVPFLLFKKWFVVNVFKQNKQAFVQIKNDLKNNGVKAEIIPVLSAFPFHVWLPLVMLCALPLVLIYTLYYVVTKRIDVLHCRSYQAGLLGYFIYKMTGTPYIFDPRSSWVEEQVLIGKLNVKSPSFRLWKKLEKLIVSNCNTCVVVSDPMKGAFTEAKQIEVIYTTAVDPSINKKIDNSNFAEHLRVLLQYKTNRTLLVFNTGRFNLWNNLEYLLERYIAIRVNFVNPLLAIISRTPSDEIYRVAKLYNLDTSDIAVYSFEPDEMRYALEACHYGLLLRPDFVSSYQVMSVKFAEYVSAGLPVICDSYLGGAAFVINKYKLGALLSDDCSENEKQLDALRQSYTETSLLCKKVARQLFSVEVHAEKYRQLYKEAVKGSS